MIKEVQASDRLRDEERAAIHRANSYIHFTPALRFGNSLATLEGYQDQPWTQIEPEARQQWQAKHDRPWEEFAGVVRQAWEKVRGQFSDESSKTGGDNTYETAFLQHYEINFRDSEHDYSKFAPAYHYGYDLGVDQRLQQRSWAEIEPEAQRYWNNHNYAGPWQDFKEAVQYAWHQARESA